MGSAGVPERSGLRASGTTVARSEELDGSLQSRRQVQSWQDVNKNVAKGWHDGGVTSRQN